MVHREKRVVLVCPTRGQWGAQRKMVVLVCPTRGQGGGERKEGHPVMSL